MREADLSSAVKRYSTLSVPAAQRLTFWNDLASETYGPLVVDCPRDTDNFDAEIAYLPLGACQLTSARSTAATVRYQRNSQSRSTFSSFLNLQLQVTGSSDASHEGHSTHLLPGDFALFDPLRPYSVTFDEPTHVCVLRIPRAQLSLRGLDLEPHLGLRIAGSGGAGAMLSGFLLSVWPWGDTVFQHAWSEPVGEMIFGLLDLVYPSSTDARESTPAAHKTLARAKQLIETHLCDPTFDIPKIADVLGVSLRYVQVLFASHGTTPSAYLLKRRLEVVAAQLRRPAGSRPRICAAAYAAGFNDLSYFHKAFRRRYGTSPGEFARAAILDRRSRISSSS
jgi:AraC-like DNA-binding protein